MGYNDYAGNATPEQPLMYCNVTAQPIKFMRFYIKATLSLLNNCDQVFTDANMVDETEALFSILKLENLGLSERF